MNIKEYIASGMIESYVLGLLTETEKTALEAACIQYPEIAAARNAFELLLEQQLLGDAKPAPAFLKKEIEEKLTTSIADSNTNELEEENTPVRRMGPWKWLAAASIILFLAAGYFAYTTNKKYKDLQAKNVDLQKQAEQSNAQLAEMNKDMDVLEKPGVKMAALKSNQDARAYATIFWDTASAAKGVYLMINNLPQPASHKQYQLWALFDNEPIDLGMIEVTEHRLLYRMKNVQNAQAFAITLEPKGGSPKPTSPPIGVSTL